MRYCDLLETAGYDLQARYSHFNELLFNGRLPLIPLRFGALKGAGGVCKASVTVPAKYAKQPTVVRKRFAKLVPDSVNIVISKTYQRSQQAMDAILVHEMIHAYIFLIEGDLYEQHGSLFLSHIKRCNGILGWDVPLKDKVEGLEVSEDIGLKTYVVVVRSDAAGKPYYAILAPAAFEKLKADLETYTARCGPKDWLKAYEITSEAWTHKALKATVQRPAQRFKIKYFYFTDDALLADLEQNGKLLLNARGMFE